jgi:hypothetical protein
VPDLEIEIYMNITAIGGALVALMVGTAGAQVAAER